MAFQTEYQFELPRGYVDEHGDLHKKGVMRLATAADEIKPVRDPRVQQNPSYLTVILLARVITKLGSLRVVDNKTIESLFTADFNFLQNFYQEINEAENPSVTAVCPECNHSFEAEINFTGEAEE
ncbi:MAG: phage tail assembly protein [Firmicutes bacterium]|nr:phage tail assembly protein [Bacillota bacterium]